MLVSVCIPADSGMQEEPSISLKRLRHANNLFLDTRVTDDFAAWYGNAAMRRNDLPSESLFSCSGQKTVFRFRWRRTCGGSIEIAADGQKRVLEQDDRGLAKPEVHVDLSCDGGLSNVSRLYLAARRLTHNTKRCSSSKEPGFAGAEVIECPPGCDHLRTAGLSQSGSAGIVGCRDVYRGSLPKNLALADPHQLEHAESEIDGYVLGCARERRQDEDYHMFHKERNLKKKMPRRSWTLRTRYSTGYLCSPR